VRWSERDIGRKRSRLTFVLGRDAWKQDTAALGEQAGAIKGRDRGAIYGRKTGMSQGLSIQEIAYAPSRTVAAANRNDWTSSTRESVAHARGVVAVAGKLLRERALLQHR